MVSPWSREYAERGESEAAAEIVAEPIPGGGHHDGADGAEPAPWIERHLAAATVALVVLAAGIAACVVIMAGGDDESGSTTTTSAPPLSLETLPLADGAADIVWLRLPVFDPVADDTAFELDDFDLRAAVVEGAAGEDLSRTRLEYRGIDAAAEEEEKSLVVTRDPATGLDELSVQLAGVTTSSLVDRRTAITYTTSSTGNWVGRWLAYGLDDRDTLDNRTSMVDAILGGPITTGSLESATSIADDGLVRLDDDTIARRYRVDVAIDVGAPPAALMFATLDASTLAAGNLPSSIAFDVYVTDRPRVVLITGRFEVDGQPRLFIQRFDQGTTDVHLGLPPEWAIIEVT